ncbi:hypothetical protein [Fodinicola feengrottensis]|uniref:hypothetical protein n=1 Tax=Fodinicola feengrottensis TaxID=435914 RepID=UPI00244331CD|nr:hypothetical protein [Fodinicola feengrottensis]
MWTAGISALLLVVVVVVVVFIGGSTTTLRVSVTGLPSGASATVTVRGPVTYTVTGSDERKVPAGAYVVQIPSARTSLGTAYADADQQSVTVPAGRTTSTTVDYATIIPDTTKVLDYTNPGIIAVDGLKVTFAANSGSRPALVPGHIFIVAEGPQTPDPLARRVVSVTLTAAGLVVQTTPVKLSEGSAGGTLRPVRRLVDQRRTSTVRVSFAS